MASQSLPPFPSWIWLARLLSMCWLGFVVVACGDLLGLYRVPPLAVVGPAIAGMLGGHLNFKAHRIRYRDHPELMPRFESPIGWVIRKAREHMQAETPSA